MNDHNERQITTIIVVILFVLYWFAAFYYAMNMPEVSHLIWKYASIFFIGYIFLNLLYTVVYILIKQHKVKMFDRKYKRQHYNALNSFRISMFADGINTLLSYLFFPSFYIILPTIYIDNIFYEVDACHRKNEEISRQNDPYSNYFDYEFSCAFLRNEYKEHIYHCCTACKWRNHKNFDKTIFKKQ